MRNLLIPILAASAGGASAFVANPSFSRNIKNQNMAEQGADMSLSASKSDTPEQDDNMQKKAEQLELYKKIYDRHGYSWLNQGIELFYQKDGEFSEDKLKDKSFEKDAEKMHGAYGYEAFKLKQVATYKRPDRFEGGKISHQIVDKMATIKERSETDPSVAEDMGVYQNGAKQLLESAAYYGLTVNAKNKDGKTPEKLAEESGNPELAEYIGQLEKSQKKPSLQAQIGGKIFREVNSGMAHLEQGIKTDIAPNLQRQADQIRHAAQISADRLSSFASGVKKHAGQFKKELTDSFVEGYVGESDGKNESFVEMVGNTTSTERGMN